MRITKSKLKKIIQEEFRSETREDSSHVFQKIEALKEEARMNKSFGFDAKITKQYFDQLTELVGKLNQSQLDELYGTGKK